MAAKGNNNGKRTGQGASGSGEQNDVRRRNRGHGAFAEWSTADAKLLLRVVSAISAMGGAVQFGLTKSKDQYVIRVVGDGEPFNEYLRPTEDIDLWLTSFAEDYEMDGSRPDNG